MEVMLFASGKRQIAKSLDFLGVKPDSSRIGILIIGNSSQDLESSISKISGLVDGNRDDCVLELSNRKIKNIRKAFGISCEEFNIRSRRRGPEKAVVDLVIERIALLATHS